MYHAVGTAAFGDRIGIFTVSPELFRTQAEFLREWNQARISDLTSSLGDPSSSQIVITFDDGYSDNLDVAAPILAHYGLPFTVFVTSGFVRHSHPGFLSPQGLRDLASIPGATIGAHGDTHIPLSQCLEGQLASELVSSKHYLEDIIGQSVQTMSYPYGSVDRRVRNAVQMAGYSLAASSYAGLNNVDRDQLILCRTEIHNSDTVDRFCRKLSGDWDRYRFRQRDPSLS